MEKNGAPRAEPVVPPRNILLRQGFGGLSATSDIRRLSAEVAAQAGSNNTSFLDDYSRIHPRTKPVVFCVGG